MPNVEVTIPALVAKDIVLRAVVDAVGPRIGSQSRQAPAQSPPELNLQRVVVRRQAVLIKTKSNCVRVAGSENQIFAVAIATACEPT